MEIQWPLLIFSVLLGVTSGSFVFLAVGELGSVPKVGVSIRFWRAGEACPRKTDIV